MQLVYVSIGDLGGSMWIPIFDRDADHAALFADELGIGR